MQKASPYLPWSKIAGSALLLGTSAYLWAMSLGVSRALPGLPWQAVLATCLLAPILFLIWADRSSDSRTLRIGYAAAIGIGFCAFVAGAALPASAPAPLLPLGLFAVAIGSAALLWQRSRNPWSWQKKALWGFVSAALPSAFAGGAEGGAIGGPSLFFLALLMVIGTTLCLTGNESGAVASRSGKRLAWIVAIVFILGLVVASLAPGASSAASWGLRGLLAAARTVLLELLKPVGRVMEWLIGLLLLYLKKNTQEENPLEFVRGEDLYERTEEYQTPAGLKILGWLAVAALAVVFIRLVWNLLERYALRRRADDPVETRTSDWSASNAAKWAVAKAKELAAPLATLLSRGFGRHENPVDPLVSIYSEFLSLAREAGRARKPSETPLEFSRAFQEIAPQASSEIASISALFSRQFYRERGASAEELSAMRENLKSLRMCLALDREGR